jgi:hypothetical protein
MDRLCLSQTGCFWGSIQIPFRFDLGLMRYLIVSESARVRLLESLCRKEREKNLGGIYSQKQLGEERELITN